MPNRYQSAARKDLMEQIARYEGFYCLACAIEGAGRRCPPSVKLEIDHAGREMHIVCKTHNLAMRRLTLEQHELRMAEYSAENVCVRIKAGELSSSVRQQVDYRDGSIEMQASRIILDKWLCFMNEYLRDNRHITKDSAIYAGAMASGGNPSTIYRHVRTFTAFNGPFQETLQDGEKVIIFRAGASEDLLKKYGIKGNGNGHHGHKALKETRVIASGKSSEPAGERLER